MKQELSPKTIAVILGVVALIIVAVGFAFFKGGGPTPTIKPKPFTPPPGFNMNRGPGAPIGAPAQGGGDKAKTTSGQ